MREAVLLVAVSVAGGRLVGRLRIGDALLGSKIGARLAG
jgi:hypothetical protein